jgi:hypothetical protein
MKTECKAVDEALRDETLEYQEALIRHVEICPDCGRRVRMGREISAAAQSMQTSWDSPELWPRIERSLEAESTIVRERSHFPAFLRTSPLWFRWLATVACMALVALSLTLGWVLLRNPGSSLARIAKPDPEFDKKILTEQALREIEAAEANYIQSIEKLSKMTDPLLQRPTSPLLLNYRERLLILDEAISECRANIEHNRSNAHLRRELVSIYQEKQHTLADLMKEKLND